MSTQKTRAGFRTGQNNQIKPITHQDYRKVLAWVTCVAYRRGRGLSVQIFHTPYHIHALIIEAWTLFASVYRNCKISAPAPREFGDFLYKKKCFY